MLEGGEGQSWWGGFRAARCSEWMGLDSLPQPASVPPTSLLPVKVGYFHPELLSW